ncbi:MAG TPA: hypothetical protein VN616_07710 [Puia sp.]|nr:hypothetical protein [Puia sp.]
MHILLAAATTAEIRPTIDFLLKTSVSRAGEANAPTSTPAVIPLPGPHCVSIIITGIGSVATTWTLMQSIGTDRPDLMIQAGIAGCLTCRNAGETVVIRDESFADLGVWEDGRFKSPFELGLADPDAQPFSAGRLPNPWSKLIALTGLEPVEAITINEISTHPERIRWLQQNSPAVVESMEGAALHYVGRREAIPFIQLRSVSNAIGIRDKSKWNMPLAIGNLNDHLIRLLESLAAAGNIFQPRKRENL